MLLGNKIRLAREWAGLTQKELAERVGISNRTLQKYEYNQVKPKISTLERLAKELNVTLEFFDFEPDPISSLDQKKLLFVEGYENEIDINLLFETFEGMKEIIDSINDEILRKDVIEDVNKLLKQLILFYKDSVDFLNSLNSQEPEVTNEKKIMNWVTNNITNEKISLTVSRLLVTMLEAAASKSDEENELKE